MSTQQVGDLEYSAHDLRRMDKETARETLTVNQFERWEKVQSLYADAEETRMEWEAEAETVAEVTVQADMEQLGTRVDVYGNDLLVHADTESREFREAAEALDDEYGDIEAGDTDDVDAERLDDLADHLLEMLDHVIVKWGETDWSELTESQRAGILRDARGKWGVDGLMLAWSDILVGVREDREEVVGRIEKFRDPERRGDR